MISLVTRPPRIMLTIELCRLQTVPRGDWAVLLLHHLSLPAGYFLHEYLENVWWENKKFHQNFFPFVGQTD